MMIDFHTHILPGIDDGSKSVEESIDMLLEEKDQGVEVVVLTPHFYPDKMSPEDFISRRNQAYDLLVRALDERDIEVPILLAGAEVQYFEGMASNKDISKLCIGDSRVLLVEMPFSGWSHRVIKEIIDLNSRKDIVVMLAHIDRYLKWQSDDVWDELLDEGIIMQSNVSFFNHWKTKRKAVKMFDNGMIHVLGSDCHNMTGRPPELGNAAKFMMDVDEDLISELGIRETHVERVV